MALFSLAGSLFCSAGAVLLNIMPGPIYKLAGLFLAYLGGSVLLLNVCSFQMCAALLVCGIGVTVLLGTSLRGNNAAENIHGDSRMDILFRAVLALICGILAYAASDSLYSWIPVGKSILFVVLWSSILSLFSLSLDDGLPARCVYLQTICLSFMITYVYMESSVLVFAFFAVINLMLAFGGSVLSMGKPAEEAETES